MSFKDELITLVEKYQNTEEYINPHLLLGIAQGLTDIGECEENIDKVNDLIDHVWDM